MAAVLTNIGTQTRTRLAEVETARLRLRPFTLEDIDGLWRIASDPEVMRYIGDGVPFTREETLSNLTNIVNVSERRGYGRWALEKKEGGGLIGYCGLACGSEEVGVELVYLLARAEWGKGIVNEAAWASLRYGFESLGFDSIAAVTRPDNWPSRRVMERLGMKFERAAFYHGYSCVCYRLAREDCSPPDGAIYRVR
jgi:ribosomal-protein-alanine N-acetyltransferase